MILAGCLLLGAAAAAVQGGGSEGRARPPEALVVAAVDALVAEEGTQAICVLVSDGQHRENISPAAHESLRKRYPRFFECDGVKHTFTIGPVVVQEAGTRTLLVRRESAHSACRYVAVEKDGAWKLTKEPCAAM